MIRRTALLVKQTPPNKDWLLAMLSTFDSENELFSKGYVKPKVDFRGNELDEDLVDNTGDFFTGLPLAKKVRKNGMRFGGDKEAQKRKKEQKLQQQMNRLNAQMQRLANEREAESEVADADSQEEQKHSNVRVPRVGPNVIGNADD